MLTAPDADLVRRDPAMPGLAVLLDDEALLACLRGAAPTADLRSLTCTYVRYKPATSCLAAFRCDLGGAGVDLYARIYRTDDFAKAFKPPAVEPVPGPLGPGRLQLPELAGGVWSFPNDAGLESLRLLADRGSRAQVLRTVLPPHQAPADGGEVLTLAYKPERRYVGKVSMAGVGAVAAIKLYTPEGYAAAARNAKVLTSDGDLRLPARLGRSERFLAVALEWLAGRPLSELLAGRAELVPPPATLRRVGRMLAALHDYMPKKLRRLDPSADAAALHEVARTIAILWPPLAARATQLADRVAETLARLPPLARATHGDFYAKQVLVTPAREREDAQIAFVDFDQAAAADPARDVGNFIAHLERHAVSGNLPQGRALPAAEALQEGYVAAAPAGNAVIDRVPLYAAASLLRVAPHAFRSREAHWPARMEMMLDRAADFLRQLPAAPSAPRAWAPQVAIADPFGIAADPAMPFAAGALDPGIVPGLLREALRESGVGPDIGPDLCLRSARVIRHKPGRRCAIEYVLERPSPPAGGAPEPLALIGKIRAKGLNSAAHAVQEALWRGAFSDNAADGVCVPRPMGAVPELRMTLQLKVPGIPAGTLLGAAGGVELAARIAEAAHKLHEAGVPAQKRHTPADELAILHNRLTLIAERHRRWSRDIEDVLSKCDAVAARCLPEGDPRLISRGVHRDFHPDQVLVEPNSGRLFLLDFDLYCAADPALDVGNFVGHLKELSVRKGRARDAFAEHEEAMVGSYARLAGGSIVPRIRAYAALTLARHIHICTQFPDRQAFLSPLIEAAQRALDEVLAWQH